MSPGQQVGPVFRPADHSGFSHPPEVVYSQILETDEKRRILLDWLQDEFALLLADNEGMFGNRSPRPDQVLQALRVLEGVSRP